MEATHRDAFHVSVAERRKKKERADIAEECISNAKKKMCAAARNMTTCRKRGMSLTSEAQHEAPSRNEINDKMTGLGEMKHAKGSGGKNNTR